jgi:hypothetical protein
VVASSIAPGMLCPQKKLQWSTSRSACRKRLQRGVKRTIRKSRVTPQARSTQSVAERFRSSTSYLQSVRDAVANLVMERQLEYAVAKLPATRAVFRLALDETEQKVSFTKTFKFLKKKVAVNQTISSFVAHGCLRVAAREGREFSITEIVLPLLALASKTSNCMMHTVVTLLDTLLKTVTAMVGFFTFVFSSDSAVTNRLLFRQIVMHFKPVLAMHGRCFMHQIALACAVAAKALRVIGPVFCGSTLLHYGDTQEHLGHALVQWLNSRRAILITHADERSQAFKSYVGRLIDLVHWDEELLSTEALRRSPLGRHKLQCLIERLIPFLHGDLSTRQWVHFCPFGCCRTLAETRGKLVEILQALFLHHVPPIPALNRWTQLYPALAWWCVTVHLHGMMPKLWADVYGGGAHNEDTVMVDHLAPVSDEVLSTIKSKRAGKVLRWIRHPKTPDELAVMCMGFAASILFPCESLWTWPARSRLARTLARTADREPPTAPPCSGPVGGSRLKSRVENL